MNRNTFDLFRVVLFVLLIVAFVGLCAIETTPADLPQTYLP